MARIAMATVRTSALLQRLFKSATLDEYLRENASAMRPPSFSQYIADLAMARGEAHEKVIARAGIERTYGHQLFRGIRKPSRDKALQLSFGFDLDADEAQLLLRAAQMGALYPRIPRDAAILYCLNNRYTIVEAQLCLEGRGFTPLGGDDGHGNQL